MRRLLSRQPLGVAGAVVVLVLVAAALLAPVLAPHGPKDAVFGQFVPPGREFPMGTDNLGRDVLSRIMWGARLSLYVGLVSVRVGVTIGSLWGIFTGYLGGIADVSSQRVIDCVMALPPIVLALSLMAAVGQSVNNVILALTILLTPTAARTVRSVALGIAASPYVEAARAAGTSHVRIVLRHILPNCLATYRMDGKPFVIPGGPLVPIAACAAIAWLFFETARDGEQFKGLIVALAVIFVLYGLRALRLKLRAAPAPAK